MCILKALYLKCSEVEMHLCCRQMQIFIGLFLRPSVPSSFHNKCPVCGYGVGYKPVIVIDILLLFIIYFSLLPATVEIKIK